MTTTPESGAPESDAPEPHAVTAGTFEFGNDGPSIIVVGVDGSDSSLRAAAYALGLARRQGSRMVALYVGQTSTAQGFVPQMVPLQEDLRASVLKELQEQVAAAQDRSGVKAEVLTRSGDPSHEVAALADELRADAVVVGASVKAGHNLIGSTAGKLVRKAHWPVTVVP